MDYLSQYFDVTTSDVVERILWSAIPVRKMASNQSGDQSSSDIEELTAPLTIESSGDNEQNNSMFDNNQLNGGIQKKKPLSYMERFIQSRPDLYGPFWISTTLIFAIAIFSNLISFINYRSKLSKVSEEARLSLLSKDVISENSSSTVGLKLGDQLEDWHYSMDELNMSASIITFYITVIPTILWFVFWFRGCAKYYTLLETICAYGYSLSIFVPMAALLMVQATIFRYLVVLLGSLVSGLVLMMSFVPVVRSDPGAGSSHIILLTVPLCQLGLAYIMHRIMLQ